MDITDEQLDKIGTTAERIESMLAATLMPLPADFHLKQIKSISADIAGELKKLYTEISGNDPWEE